MTPLPIFRYCTTNDLERTLSFREDRRWISQPVLHAGYSEKNVRAAATDESPLDPEHIHRLRKSVGFAVCMLSVLPDGGSLSRISGFGRDRRESGYNSFSSGQCALGTILVVVGYICFPDETKTLYSFATVIAARNAITRDALAIRRSVQVAVGSFIVSAWQSLAPTARAVTISLRSTSSSFLMARSRSGERSPASATCQTNQ
jgi:hypothetical protein